MSRNCSNKNTPDSPIKICLVKAGPAHRRRQALMHHFASSFCLRLAYSATIVAIDLRVLRTEQFVERLLHSIHDKTRRFCDGAGTHKEEACVKDPASANYGLTLSQLSEKNKQSTVPLSPRTSTTKCNFCHRTGNNKAENCVKNPSSVNFGLPLSKVLEKKAGNHLIKVNRGHYIPRPPPAETHGWSTWGCRRRGSRRVVQD
ncbi:hypothetical protein AC579_1885 [Pseudocercospora musae]|uniref:Uncharacterized protein n=1 Tax=Pseudocercospora musae TaxID=113226 RepID=A0A139HZP6_9PEZI|nr:hypothetical protein AC579_1885 [Pseudocercospora musae]